MKDRKIFNFPRVLVLALGVLFLSFVYFVVRSGYATQVVGLKNPADIPGLETQRERGSTVPAALPKKGYLVIEDREDEVSVSARDAVELTLESLGEEPVYAQEPSREEIRQDWEGIILTRTYLPDYETMQELFTYAQEGGFLIFAVRPEANEVFKSLYQQMGIYEHYYYKNSEGFHVVPGILSSGSYDMDNDPENPWLLSSMIELHVREECRVLAENDDGTPLIWDMDYGAGKILVMNNSLMVYKSSGGLMLSLMAKGKGSLMYPVVNAKVFALESFPLPTDVNGDYIKGVYLRSGNAFLREIWWPSMVQLGLSADLTYTAGILTAYAGEEAYGSDSVAAADMDFDFYAKELARFGGELAFTGFNQKPLYFSPMKKSMDFVPWTGPETAETRTREALSWIEGRLPAYRLYSFLPTERLMDDQGYALIRESFPALQVVCGDFKDRQRYYQNFTVDEYGIVQFPVVTSGFQPGDMERWDLMNVVTAKGLVFHSADVSDLMLEQDPDRSWHQISKAFFEYCQDYMGDLPLDSLTLTQAGQRVREMYAMDPQFVYEEKGISVSIENRKSEASFMLLTDKTPRPQPGVRCAKIHDGKYLITTELDAFQLVLD